MNQKDSNLSPGIDHALAFYTALFKHIANHATLYKALLGKHGSSWLLITRT